ncbi:hypothetical protein DE146DRAFT_677293 [Phaeosphaeria sp. MPI-PUGE-AT-0046c]|nr:hypothetical protein DE146DRAFT_677293 [Phaeosphaeria sp. MPI-PUGE-AT-0046c]
MGSRLDKNSDSVRKRIEKHSFDGEDGEEYKGSAFGGFTDYFRRKKIKLQNLDADIRSQAGDKPPVFKGIVAHVNGYTQPSLNDLHTLIVQHGGGFMQYLDGKTTVTHIIASSLTPKKVVEFRKYRIVKPAWVNVLAFDNGRVMNQANVKARGYRDQTDASWYTGQLRASQAGPSSTPMPAPTPSAPMRSRFSKQRLPTPDDDINDIDDLPPSHQPVTDPTTSKKPQTLVTPPKSSPTIAAQHDLFADDELDADAALHDSLYDGPTKDVQGMVDERVMDFIVAAGPTTAPDGRQLTAEEHNAILLRDPKIRKSTVVDPNFLEQYYRESRLHHLSTWKADLKSQLQALAAEKTSSQKAKQKRLPGARTYILHVDFDSFFAAVSLKKNPQYKDKPAVVAHGQGSGSEIASCNYPARKFGVKNGMWMKRAQELCPDLKILPYDFPAYEEASRAFYDTILATGGLVQSVSIDEALIDVSAMCIAAGGSDGRTASEGSDYREQAKADEIAQSLRTEVKARTGCDVSVGIGGNILLAKVALRRAKPASQQQIKPEQVLDVVGELQVQDLPGVAWSIGGKLEEIGVKYVKDIRELSKEKLVQTLGPKTGEKLWEYSRGIDRQEVGEQVVRKSVSAEVNWGEKVKGKQFTMKIMRRSPDAPLDPPKHLGHGKCDTHNKSMVLGVATNAKEVLTKEAFSMLRGFGFTPGELRGIGIQMTKLEPMKSATDGSLEGSQRRLQFKVGIAEPVSARKVEKLVDKLVDEDPIQDEPETPRKPKNVAEEQLTFGPSELNHLTPSRRPLNVLGTQFIMPTQVDPRVLDELPEDIRSKLLRQTRQTSPSPAARSPARHSVTTTPTKALPFAMTALPAQSQLDPDILAALPAEVRAEVLAQYAAGTTPASPSRRPKNADQTLLPQSPRKNRIIGIPAKKAIVPVKRGRGRPPRSAMLAAAAQTTSLSKNGKTLTQANFISRRNPALEDGGRETSAGPVDNNPAQPKDDDLDTDFLSALPPELRAEVVAEHKRKKLQAFRLAINKPKPKPLAPAPRPVQRIKVPRPPRPTFTTQKLSAEPDLRKAMKEWVKEFADEGPYAEDVGALCKYLGKVVREEKNLSKAVGVVRWLEWVVDDEEVDGQKWGDALGRVRERVRKAGGERGFGDVEFD